MVGLLFALWTCLEGKVALGGNIDYIEWDTNKLVKKDERYEVHDVGLGGEIILSRTVLHPSKATTGHAQGEEHVYFFAQGGGLMRLGEKVFPVESGNIVVIPKAILHRVYNTGKKDLILFALFWAFEGRGE